MVTGDYIAELFRLSLVSISEKTKAVYFPWIERLKPWSVKGEFLSDMLKDGGGLDIEGRFNDQHLENVLTSWEISSTPEEREMMVLMARVLMRRSAYLVASVHKGIIDVVDPKYKEVHKIAVVGSIYEHVPGYRKFLNQALRELVGRKARKIKVAFAPTGPGGAIIAATASENAPSAYPLWPGRFQRVPVFSIAMALPLVVSNIRAWLKNVRIIKPLNETGWYNLGSFHFPSVKGVSLGGVSYAPLTVEAIEEAFSQDATGYSFQVSRVTPHKDDKAPAIPQIYVDVRDQDNLLVGAVQFVHGYAQAAWSVDLQFMDDENAERLVNIILNRISAQIGVARTDWNPIPAITSSVSLSSIANKRIGQIGRAHV